MSDNWTDAAFDERLVAALRGIGLEAFAPEVRDLVERIRSTEVCPECRVIPEPHVGPGIPIRPPGVAHRSDCPTLPQMSPEARADLARQLQELDDARRAAWANSHNVWLR